MATPKHRVSFSLAEIQHIIKVLANETPLTSESISVVRILQIAELKIISGARTAAFSVLSPSEIAENARVTRERAGKGMVGSLGIGTERESEETAPSSLSTSLIAGEYILDNVTYPTKERYWEACYLIWRHTEDKSDISLNVVEAANEWRYLKDLMSDSEAADFETRSLGGTGGV